MTPIMKLQHIYYRSKSYRGGGEVEFRRRGKDIKRRKLNGFKEQNQETQNIKY